MTKQTVEFKAFADRIEQLDCVLTVEVNRKEIEAELYCENEVWGMPDNLEEKLNEDTYGNQWCIVDFSHISELEDGGCNITVYLQPR